MTAWYYGVEAEEFGPVDEAALAGLVRSGEISRESRLRADSTPEWGRAGDVYPDLFLAPASGWAETKPHPWRRYAARALDNIIVGGISWFLVGLVVALVAPGAIEKSQAYFGGPFGRILDGMLTLAVALPGNALMIGLTGISIGKWVFGVRVLRGGQPIGFPAAFAREIEVWWRGLACGVPFVSLVTLWGQFDRLGPATRETPWDQRQHNTVTYRPDSPASRIWMWVTVAVMVVITAILRLAALK